MRRGREVEGCNASRRGIRLAPHILSQPGLGSHHTMVGPNSATRSRNVSRARANAVLDQLRGGILDTRKFAELTGNEKEANRRKWKERMGYCTRQLV